MQDRRRLFFINESDIPSSAHSISVGDIFNVLYFPINYRQNGVNIFKAKVYDAPYVYNNEYYANFSISGFEYRKDEHNSTMSKQVNCYVSVSTNNIYYYNRATLGVALYLDRFKLSINNAILGYVSEFLGYLRIEIDGSLQVTEYNSENEDEYPFLIDMETT